MDYEIVAARQQSRQSSRVAAKCRRKRAPIYRPSLVANKITGVSDATRLMNAIGKGDPQAADQLLPLVYDELRRLARQRMQQECGEHTLQATALVHEAYLRLFGNEACGWNGRGHFFAAAAEAMRRILIEHARRKQAIKHGGELQRVDLDDQLPAISAPFDNLDDLLALDEALAGLAREHADKAELVKLLFFAGLTLDEAAAAMGISRTSAHRQWVFARAWLFTAINGKATS